MQRAGELQRGHQRSRQADRRRLDADKITATTVDDLVEIARRDYWRGTSRDIGAVYLVYSTDDPPCADKPGEAEPIGQGRIEFDDDPAAGYGLRPTRPSK
ncbi:hypothetical protein [Lentzea sp. CA-135723]|uniref:hypothetical protein n=1 Tax=Lentzea sp. CA-135723 TaxID=3239950 RepID=UPI003D93B563